MVLLCIVRSPGAQRAASASRTPPSPSPELESEDLRPPNLYEPAFRHPGCNAPRFARSEAIAGGVSGHLSAAAPSARSEAGGVRRLSLRGRRAQPLGPLALPLPWRASTSWPLSLVHDRGSLAPHQQRFAVKSKERQQRSRPRALPHQYSIQPALSLTLARAALDRSINQGVHRTAPRPAHRGPRSTWRSRTASEGPLAQR